MYQRIANDECVMCQKALFKGIDLLAFVLEDPLCCECRKSLRMKIRKTQFEGYPLYTMYDYKHIKQHLIRFKDYLDMPFAHIFLKPYMFFFNKMFKGYTVVVIPSSESMMRRRGFHHLSVMLEGCLLPVISCLKKEDHIQRFRKNRAITFSIEEGMSFDKVLIFDDVITSGNSMRAALKHLSPISSKIVLFSVAYNHGGGD